MQDSSGIFEEPYPVDTRRKLNVRKMFRRRPGRLLNVLYTFNLLAVSTGYCLDNISDLTSSLIIATRYINHQKQNKGAGPLIVKVNVLLI